jgi:hypothetical protein
MHSGTLLRDEALTRPTAVLFFNLSPDKLIVACKDNVFIVDMTKLSTQPFKSTPQDAYYSQHALALSEDDVVLVAGNYSWPNSVCGYNTASLERLWIQDTANEVGAVCMLGAHVLVTVLRSPTMVLDRNTGAHTAALQKVDGCIFGLGVIECLRLIRSWPHIPSDPHTSVYLAMLQHLLYKQAEPLHLPLEMWDWIAKYRL